MKIQIASDLHLEFYDFAPKSRPKLLACIEQMKAEPCDVLVLAGDIFTNRCIKRDMALFTDNWEHVVFVTGNHEYYSSSFGEMHAVLDHLSNKHSNLHWLNNNHIVIDGQRFVGSTLWFPTPRDSDGDSMVGTFRHAKLEMRLNDFSMIGGQQKGAGLYELGDKAAAYLAETVTGQDVVVTHHLPSEESTPFVFRGDEANCFYVNDMEKVIRQKMPKLWLHGHTHTPCDYELHNTRVVCNARGYYPHGITPGWKPTVVEVK